MKRPILYIILAVVLIGGVVFLIWDTNLGVSNSLVPPKEVPIEPNAWKPCMVIAEADTGKYVIRVTWDQKYGERKILYCRAVFRNDVEKQYKVIAPWLASTDIERQNMNDISIEKISTDSIIEKWR